jgi:hypothetical protein
VLLTNDIDIDTSWNENEIPEKVWETLGTMNVNLPWQHAIAGILRLPEGDMVALRLTEGPVDWFVFPCGCVMDAEDV